MLAFLVGVSAGAVAAPPGSGLREAYPGGAVGAPHGAGPAPALPLAGLLSQHRLLELSRFGLRHYDLAQHMLTQQGAVTKLLGKSNSYLRIDIITHITSFFILNQHYSMVARNLL